jgi:hypothetical protein
LAKDSIKDPYWAARAAAAATIGLVGKPEDSKDLDALWNDPKENGEVRSEAFNASHHLGLRNMLAAQQLEHLANALRSNDLMTRRWAANELAGRPEGKNILNQAATDPAHLGRREAAAALKKTHG